MGFWGNSNSTRGDEIDFGNPSRYSEIRSYVESEIGEMYLNDTTLQDKLLRLLKDEENYWTEQLDDSADAVRWRWLFGVYDQGGMPRQVEFEIKHVGNDTYIRCAYPGDMASVRNHLKRFGFRWSHKQKSWFLKNRLVTEKDIKEYTKKEYSKNATKGLRAYCEKIAYLQSKEGIGNLFAEAQLKKRVQDEKQKKLQIGISTKSSSKSSLDLESGPYSKVEQLERLIKMRNNGEINGAEFENLKKELLS
tara:strand:+ start:311 stop:1057 length:747 start_codon:yes stop_codon:yes gene_type:complete